MAASTSRRAASGSAPGSGAPRPYVVGGRTIGLAVRQEHVRIPMADGVRLAGTLYVPDGPGPFPAVLESIPYRKDDWTLTRDWPLHGAFAAAGYVSCRLDVRGSGSSEGIARDEYAEREILDNLAVIDWLAGQPWSTGAVGMFGISWGGFSALQAASRTPPALCAIIAAHFSHDRYELDVHYVGGTLHVGESVYWPVEMVGENALPPDFERFGPGWRDEWRRRLERTPPWPLEWLRHQRRDGYWRHGSAIEAWDAIEAPVLAIGGLQDGYRDAVLPVLERVRAPTRGVIGPWGHCWPHAGSPGPSIDGIGLMVRWWDRWLKGVENGADREPACSLYVVEPPVTEEYPAELPGRWWHLGRYPSALRTSPPPPLRLAGDGTSGLGTLRANPPEGGPADSTWSGPPTVGLAAPFWCGLGEPPQGLPTDQGPDDALSLTWTTEPLTEPLLIAGIPCADLWLAADRPSAQASVRLEVVAPDGASALVARGIRNLTRLDPGAEEPRPLIPGEPVRLELRLSTAGARVPAGYRLRLAIAGGAWPIAWPAPRPFRLRVLHDHEHPSSLALPTVAGWFSDGGPDLGLPAFEPAATEAVAGTPTFSRFERDEVGGAVTLLCEQGGGDRIVERDGLLFASDARYRLRLADDWSSCRAEGSIAYRLEYPAGPAIRAEARLSLSSDAEDLEIHLALDVTEDGEPFFSRTWQERVRRDLL